MESETRQTMEKTPNPQPRPTPENPRVLSEREMAELLLQHYLPSDLRPEEVGLAFFPTGENPQEALEAFLGVLPEPHRAWARENPYYPQRLQAAWLDALTLGYGPPRHGMALWSLKHPLSRLALVPPH
ncbi:hypothetical protein, partial [Calidithermus roseus]|uniref:hypothetical protein n=1 Tax=Calidithermus roseus TaxID=1644118 RepID=UPI0011C3C6B1